MPKLKLKIKNTGRVILAFVIAAFLVLGLTVALYLIARPQDIRQQAASCSQSPVDVQFRKYTGQEDPWVAGSNLTDLQVGDQIDVNCFAKNGAALLSGGKFSLKIDNLSQTLANSVFKTSTEIRALELTKAGAWQFTCSNSSSCANTDSITVAGGASQNISCYMYNEDSTECEQVSLPYDQCEEQYGEYETQAACRANNQATADLPSAGSDVDTDTSDSTCTTVYVSDSNHDCKVTIEDYNLFLKDFSDHFEQ